MPAQTELHDRVGRALVRMIRRAEEAQEHAAREHGLHPTDFRCIGYLHEQRRPVSPKDIIAYLGLTSGAGTALLDRLETAGFVARIRNTADRRSVLIVLDTDAAAEPIALFDRVQAKYRAATADLTPADLAAIATYLERVEALSAEMSEGLYGSGTPFQAAS